MSWSQSWSAFFCHSSNKRWKVCSGSLSWLFEIFMKKFDFLMAANQLVKSLSGQSQAHLNSLSFPLGFCLSTIKGGCPPKNGCRVELSRHWLLLSSTALIHFDTHICQQPDLDGDLKPSVCMRWLYIKSIIISICISLEYIDPYHCGLIL